MNLINECIDNERLYLLNEDKNEIYVNNCELLQQHQIDGLRFIFKQFHKKNPGVIVNFPPACGKSVTVALFLNAVDNLLKYPILILCDDDDEMQYWKQQFLKWTDYNDETIAMESLNPFIKGKRLFLKKTMNLNSYLRRHWSMVIVKEDVINRALQLVFEADFKIWVTSTDIKKDAQKLSLVYTWLYPKLKINVNDFVANKNNRAKEIFHKSIRLDIFMKDVVIRKYVNIEPFQATKRSAEKLEIEIETNDQKRSKKSIKNKDATGTKIKRSRRILNDDDIIVENDHKQDNNKNCNTNSGHDSTKLDVESFIRDRKPLESDDRFEFDNLSRLCKKEDTKMDFQITQSSLHLVYEDALQEQSTESLNFDDNSELNQNDTKDSVNKNEFNVDESIPNLKDATHSNTNLDEAETDTMEIVVNIKSDISTEQNIDRNSDNIESIQNISDIPYIAPDWKDNDSDTMEIIVKVNSDIDINESNIETHNDVIENIQKEQHSSDTVSDLDQNETDTMEIVVNLKSDAVTNKNNGVAELVKNKSYTDVKNNVDVNIDNNETKSDESDKDLDFKISDMEEKALRKFKGSILDSIF